MVPDGVPGEILKLGGEAMTPFLASLLEISLNKATIPSDWKKASVFPIYKGGDQVWDKMIGYTSDSMGLDRDTLVKVKSSQCART